MAHRHGRDGRRVDRRAGWGFGRGVTAIVASVALVALASCSNASSSGDKTTAPTGATGTTAPGGQFADLKKIAAPDPCVADPGVTGDTIKVGVIGVESPPAAAQSFQSAEDGIKARIAQANASGELGSRKISLVFRDDTNDQTRNGEVARDLVESQKVFGIIEVTANAAGSAQYLNEKAIPVAGWHVGVPAWSTNANMFTFRLGTAADPDHSYTTRNADLLKKLGVTKVALIGGGNQSSVTFIDRIAKTIAKSTGIKVVYQDTKVTQGQTDFTAEIQRIKSSGADGLFTGLDFIPNTSISAGLKSAGVSLKAVLFPGGYDPRVTALPGVEGAIFGLEFKPLELKTPSEQDFDHWLPKSVVRGQLPYVGWLSAEMFIQGVKDAGVSCPTRKAFINNLRMEHAYTANGAFDPVDLSQGFGEEFRCAYYVKVVNKAFVPQFGGKQFCGKPITF
jgi:branched-chain amino acid transport system substrate-binding protein